MWNFPPRRALLSVVSVALGAMLFACASPATEEDAPAASEAAYTGCRPVAISVGVSGTSVSWTRLCDDEAPFYVLGYAETGLPSDCVAALDSSGVQAQRRLLDAALAPIGGRGLTMEELEFLQGVVGRQLRKAASQKGAERTALVEKANASMRAFFVRRACAKAGSDPACAPSSVDVAESDAPDAGP